MGCYPRRWEIWKEYELMKLFYSDVLSMDVGRDLYQRYRSRPGYVVVLKTPPSWLGGESFKPPTSLPFTGFSHSTSEPFPNPPPSMRKIYFRPDVFTSVWKPACILQRQ